MSMGFKEKPTLEKFWFTMGEIAYQEGFKIEEACPYGSETRAFVQFCAGWNYADVYTTRMGNPTPLAVDLLTHCPNDGSALLYGRCDMCKTDWSQATKA